LVDLQEEKQFAEAELHENLNFEKEQNKQLRSELESQKTENANNVSGCCELIVFFAVIY